MSKDFAASNELQVIRSTHFTDQNWTPCNMSKERIIIAKPIFLTAKHASKLLGKLSTTPGVQSLQASTDAIKLPINPTKYNSEFSDSEFSNLSEIDDTFSTISDNVFFDKENCSKTMYNKDKCLETLDISGSSLQGMSHISRSSDIYHCMNCNHPAAEKDYCKKKGCICISPSLCLPISHIPSNASTFNGRIEDTVFENVKLSDSMDRLSEHSSYSYSSSVSQEAFSVKLDSNKKNDRLDSSVQNEKHYLDFEKEIKELKNSLKLAEADTAILVSSKQQLQLDNLDLSESLKFLKQDLDKHKQSLVEKEVEISKLKRSNSVIEKNSFESNKVLENDLKDLKMKLKTTNDDLALTIVEKEDLKKNLSDVSQQCKEANIKNHKLEEEVNKLLEKCVKMEFLANQASANNSDSSEYINTIRIERDNYAQKLQLQEQEVLNKQITISKLENKLSELSQEQSTLGATNKSLLQTLKDKERHISNLNSQISTKIKEKQILDGAITRLQEDLFRVESSFTKIKQDMTQKSLATQQQTAIKKHFESQISLLQSDLEVVRKDSLSFSQKIRDKNNQLSQLSDQLKRSFLSKRKCDSEIKSLKSQLNNQQTLLNEARKNENNLKRLLDEKLHLVLDKDITIQSYLRQIESFDSKEKLNENSAKQRESELNAKNLQISSLQQETKDLQLLLSDTRTLLNTNEITVIDLQQQVKHYNETRISLESQIDKLQTEQIQKQHDGACGDVEVEQMSELISQLQASRREQFERTSKVEEEKKAIQIEKEKLNKEKNQLEINQTELNKTISALNQQNTYLEQQLIKLKDDLLASELEISNSIENVKKLRQDYVGLNDKLEQQEQELTRKAHKIASLTNSNKISNEEVEIAKKEMNSLNLRLMEILSNEEKNNEDKEKADLLERLRTLEMERDKLKEAVMQQQRYIESLQVHYQNWISDATVKYQQLQTQSSINDSSSMCDASCQTSHEEKLLPSSSYLKHGINQSHLRDSSTQTTHDDKPLTSSPFKLSPPSNGQICTNCGKSTFALSPTTPQHETSGAPKHTSKSSNRSELKSYSDVACQVPINTKCSSSEISTQTIVYTQTNSCQTEFERSSINEVHIHPHERGDYLRAKPGLSSLNNDFPTQFASSSTQTIKTSVDFSQQAELSKKNSDKNKDVLNVFTQTDTTLIHPTQIVSKSNDFDHLDPAETDVVITKDVASTQTEALSQSLVLPSSSINPVSSTGSSLAGVCCTSDKATSYKYKAILTRSEPTLVSFQPCEIRDNVCQTEEVLTNVDKINCHAQTDLSNNRRSDSLCSQTPSTDISTPSTSNHDLLTRSDDTTLSSNQCASTQTEFPSENLPNFPDPQNLLNHFDNQDRAKLKAYKQTVKVLRSKLKQAEEQLTDSKALCSSLKLEVEALKCEASPSHLLLSEDTIPSQFKEENLKLVEELLYWKDISHQREGLIDSLQVEISEIKKRHGKEREAIHRKAKATRLMKDKKIEEINERLKMLVEANERLRSSVSKLQVKLTSRSREFEACQRERLRYQHRARKLQSDLRSLSWLSSNSNEKKTENKDSSLNDSSSSQLPSSVLEIDSILKDLRKEIGVLEEHLHHHSSAVYQSNASLKERHAQEMSTNEDPNLNTQNYSRNSPG